MCIWFGYNPWINFCHFFHFVIFWPQILWKYIDSGYLVSATPYTISCLSLCNFAHLFFHGLKMCMWFGFNLAVNCFHFSTLLTLSFFAGATSTSPKFDLYWCFLFFVLFSFSLSLGVASCWLKYCFGGFQTSNKIKNYHKLYIEKEVVRKSCMPSASNKM